MANDIKLFVPEGVSLLERQPRHFSTAVGKLARTIPKLDNRCWKRGRNRCFGFSTGGESSLPRSVWLEPCPRLQESPWFLRQTMVTTRRKKSSSGGVVRARGLETGFAFQVFSQKLILSPSLLSNIRIALFALTNQKTGIRKIPVSKCQQIFIWSDLVFRFIHGDFGRIHQRAQLAVPVCKKPYSHRRANAT